MFNGILIEKQGDSASITLKPLDDSQLPAGDVVVNVEYSSLNYKDAMALTGNPRIIRKWPLVPGIDFAGTVESSQNQAFNPGDKVLLNGHGVGEEHWGGLAQKARIRGEWLIPLPSAYSTRQAMAIGTAGYTAMLCVLALERQGIFPDSGDILVTGASGGVGSVAVAILAKLGYRVVAMTGRLSESDYLKSLGAQEVIDRSIYAGKAKPLASHRWAGAVDVAGGNTLANVLSSMQHGGVVAACGLADSMDLPTTVAPFILRGVQLIGIDSVNCPKKDRIEAWQRLPQDLDIQKLESMIQEIGLTQAIAIAPEFLKGQVRGRVVVDTSR